MLVCWVRAHPKEPDLNFSFKDHKSKYRHIVKFQGLQSQYGNLGDSIYMDPLLDTATQAWDSWWEDLCV